MSIPSSYNDWQMSSEREWESRCACCGACCGALEDPCEHLCPSSDGKFTCAIYADRFGMCRTVSGQVFRCIPIREKLGYSWPGDERCGYRKPCEALVISP